MSANSLHCDLCTYKMTILILVYKMAPNTSLTNHSKSLYKRWLILIRKFHSRVAWGISPSGSHDPDVSLSIHSGSSRPPTECGVCIFLILMGLPLGFLPYHRSDRFPRSTQEPDSRSRHLYAGRRPGSKQDSPELILGYKQPPVLTSPYSFSTPHQWFACARLLDPYLTSSCEAFSLTLTTLALYQRSLRWFETCTCKPTPRGLPSSFV